MRDILFKKRINKKTNTKVLCTCQKNKEKDCKTIIRKGFYYNVSKTAKVDTKLEPPEIYIKKILNSAERVEKFYFQVRGSFYITHERVVRKAKFHHSLSIKISWSKNFSPKKSAVLTE